MIMTELPHNLNGVWAESHLSHQLQQIVARYRTHLDGSPVDRADLETESKSGTYEGNY